MTGRVAVADSFTLRIEDAVAAFEPASFALIGTSLLGLAAARRRLHSWPLAQWNRS